MTNYDEYKFWIDIVVSIFLPIVSALIGITLKQLTAMKKSLDSNAKAADRRMADLERTINIRDSELRKEFNARFKEERDLVYRIIDTLKGDHHGN
jgi:hypothetical protein